MTRLLLRLAEVALVGSVGVSAPLMPAALPSNPALVLPLSSSGLLRIATAAGPVAGVSPLRPAADLPHNLFAPDQSSGNVVISADGRIVTDVLNDYDLFVSTCCREQPARYQAQNW